MKARSILVRIGSGFGRHLKHQASRRRVGIEFSVRLNKGFGRAGLATAFHHSR